MLREADHIARGIGDLGDQHLAVISPRHQHVSTQLDRAIESRSQVVDINVDRHAMAARRGIQDAALDAARTACRDRSKASLELGNLPIEKRTVEIPQRR
jgi:hypothetical protein